jgi:hypothetical protein
MWTEVVAAPVISSATTGPVPACWLEASIPPAGWLEASLPPAGWLEASLPPAGWLNATARPAAAAAMAAERTIRRSRIGAS